MKASSSKSASKILVLSVPIILVALLLLVCFFAGGLYDTLRYRHERAFQRWESRRPDHYRYVLALKGDLTYQDYLVEVTAGNLVRLTDLKTGVSTGIPGSASSSFLQTNAWVRNSLLIDGLFIRIQGAIHPPTSVSAFMSRTNPAFYAGLSTAGWLSTGPVTCDPPYPRVSYNPVYGYPEDLQLAGQPCSYEVEYSTPVHLTIGNFQPLP